MGNFEESVIEALERAFEIIIFPVAVAIVCYATGRLCATFLTPGIRVRPLRREVLPPRAKRAKREWHGFTYKRDGEREYTHRGLATIGLLLWIAGVILWKVIHGR